jgi:hypothetical protein
MVPLDVRDGESAPARSVCDVKGRKEEAKAVWTLLRTTHGGVGRTCGVVLPRLYSLQARARWSPFLFQHLDSSHASKSILMHKASLVNLAWIDDRHAKQRGSMGPHVCAFLASCYQAKARRRNRCTDSQLREDRDPHAQPRSPDADMRVRTNALGLELHSRRDHYLTLSRPRRARQSATGPKVRH